jgi:hypothetical protein
MLKLIHTKPAYPQNASRFRIPRYRDLQRRGVLPSGFSGAKTPKLIHAKPTHPQSASGFRISGFRDLRRRGVLPSGFPGAETTKLIHAKPTHPQSASGFHIPGFRDLRRRGVFPSGFPGAETLIDNHVSYADGRFQILRDFQDFVESTLLPMQGLRSTVNSVD